MKLSTEGRERIRQANPIDAVVRDLGVELKKVGRNLMGRCPFHKDTNPSLSVQVEEGRFRCFGCGENGDVFHFVQLERKLDFPKVARWLAERAGLPFESLREGAERRAATSPARRSSARPAATAQRPRRTDTNAAARPQAAKASSSPATPTTTEPSTPQLVAAAAPNRGELLAAVVDHYHRTFCESREAQHYLAEKRGLHDPDLLRVLKVGYADGSLLERLPRKGELRDHLVELGVVTRNGRELFAGCVVVPIPDPLTGAWVNLYGRAVNARRHSFLPGPRRGVLNFQAAKSSREVVLTESVLDALSFIHAGIAIAIPIYGTQGFTDDHLDLLKRERVERVTLALDTDEPGRAAAAALRAKLTEAGLAVRIATLPAPMKDANELLVACNGNAPDVFRQVLDEAEPRPQLPAAEPATVEAPRPQPAPAAAGTTSPATSEPPAPSQRTATRDADQLILTRLDLVYHARLFPPQNGRLQATIKVERAGKLHVERLDLYASRARQAFAKSAERALGVSPHPVEADLLALLVEAERSLPEEGAAKTAAPPPPTDAERARALAFLRRPDLLAELRRHLDVLGFVGEETNAELLYLIAISRMLKEPLNAVILSQSGAGKSSASSAIERLLPPEKVVAITRMTPQSLYYVDSSFLDGKVVMVEERQGSQEAD